MYSHEVLDTIGHQSQMSRSLGQVWTLRSLMQLHSPHWLGRHHLKYVQNYFMKQNVNRLVQLVDFYMILYWYTQYELSHSTCKFTKLHHLLSIDGFVFCRSLHTAALNRCTRNSGFGSTLLRKIVKSCIPITIALFSPKCPSDVSYKCVIQMCHTNVSLRKKKTNVLFESRTEFHSTEGAASVEQLKEKTWWITDHMRRSHVTWVGFCHLWR